MHERKIRMFDESDAFVVLPGAIGTLEEAVELISWRRLGLHAKPIVFHNPADFWAPLFALFDHFIAARLVQPEFAELLARRGRHRRRDPDIFAPCLERGRNRSRCTWGMSPSLGAP